MIKPQNKEKINEHQNGNNTIQNVMNRFATWLKNKTCPHTKRKEIFVYLPDNYIEEECAECGKRIFSYYY